MAKPIPKKKAKPEVKAKKKENPKVKKALAELVAKVDGRYAWASKMYEIQSADTQRAVDLMVKNLKTMANPPRFVLDGQAYPVDEAILRDIQRKSHTWIAMRLLVACAEWGINIGNFKAPKSKCIRCGTSVKPKAKKKIKAKGKK